MAELSPAARAIIDAIGIPVGSSLYPVGIGFAAIALEKAASEVAPADFRSRRQTNINRKILATAAELRSTLSTSQED